MRQKYAPFSSVLSVTRNKNNTWISESWRAIKHDNRVHLPYSGVSFFCCRQTSVGTVYVDNTSSIYKELCVVLSSRMRFCASQGFSDPETVSFSMFHVFHQIPWQLTILPCFRQSFSRNRGARSWGWFTRTTQAQHKRKHKLRVNQDDASANTKKRNARFCLCLRRPGSHVAYACAYACACVVLVNQPLPLLKR